MTLPRLITAEEVAGCLGISKWQVYDYVNRGILPAVRLGRSMRFDPERLRAWLDAGGTPASDSHASHPDPRGAA